MNQKQKLKDKTGQPITIAVAGKGGTGKTTVAGLLIHLLVSKELSPVLAIDADPNANLDHVLGYEVKRTIGELEQETLGNINDIPAGMNKKTWLEYNLQQLLVEGKGLDLLVMGRGEGPECYCAINHILRAYMNSLSKNYRFVVLDNEAGMEHISRRTTSDIDILLMVSDGNPVAIHSARRINRLVDELDIKVKKRYLILNNLWDHLPQKAEEEMEKTGLETLGEIPKDENLLELCWEGKPIKNLSVDSPALKAMEEVLEKILNQVLITN